MALRETRESTDARRMAWAGLGVLAMLNLLAFAQPLVHHRDLLLEWRKGPLIYNASPYSSANAAKAFWPVAAVMLDLYVGLSLAWDRWRGRRFRTIAVAVSLLLVWAAGESLTRLVIRRFMFLQYRPHPDLFWYNRPLLRSHSDETDPVPKSTNSRGFRGTDEIPPAKRPGEYRVFVVGDSSTFGLGVPDSRTYSVVLEQALRRATGREVRVVNSGCPGHTSYQGLFLLRHAGLPLHPDLIIWAYNNDPCLEMARELDRITQSPRLRAVERVLYRSDLFLLFQRVAMDALFRWNAAEVAKRYPREQEGWVRRIPFDDFREYLREYAALAREHGSRILFLRMPLNGPACERNPIFRTSFDNTYRDYVAAFCATQGLPYLDFEADFARQYRPSLFIEEHLFHPSDEGHRIIGETIAQYLLTNGLARPVSGAAPRADASKEGVLP